MLRACVREAVRENRKPALSRSEMPGCRLSQHIREHIEHHQHPVGNQLRRRPLNLLNFEREDHNQGNSPARSVCPFDPQQNGLKQTDFMTFYVASRALRQILPRCVENFEELRGGVRGPQDFCFSSGPTCVRMAVRAEFSRRLTSVESKPSYDFRITSTIPPCWVRNSPNCDHSA